MEPQRVRRMQLEVLVSRPDMNEADRARYRYERARQGALIASFDQVIRMVHEGGESELCCVSLYSDIILNVIIAGMRLDRDVVIDFSDCEASDRRKWILIAHGAKKPIVAIVFPNDQTVYQPISEAEGFDNIVPVDVAREMQKEGHW